MVHKKSIQKVISKVEDAANFFIRVFFIIIFIIGCLCTYDTWKVFETAQDKSTLSYKPADGQLIGQELKDNVAWLTLDDSKVDYPVMQGDTNEMYLNTDPYGRYSLSGSIFLDSRNRPDFSDGYNLIYGHHMSDGMMFGAIDEWIEKDFYETHKTGTLTTESAIYRLDVIGIESIEAAEDRIFQPVNTPAADSISYTNSMLGTDSSHILALSTCKLPESTLRTVLFCKMTLVYQGDVAIAKKESKESCIQTGGKVYSDVRPVKPNPNFLDSLLKALCIN